MKLIIHAPNVHQGGGAVLLNALIGALDDSVPVHLVLDARMELRPTDGKRIEVSRIKPSVAARFGAERLLHGITEAPDTVLCFGNLPPLFRLRGRVCLFIQNRYLLDYVAMRGHRGAAKLRIGLERRWLQRFVSRVDEIIVQTPGMSVLARERFGDNIDVRVSPFVANSDGYSRRVVPGEQAEPRRYDFVYVASHDPHKNHANLLAAWRLLANDGIYPALGLTAPQAAGPALRQWAQPLVDEAGLKVEFFELKGIAAVATFYRQAGALIFPSTVESFGLPLIEARQAGLPVLAPELDYVRDVVDPEQTFDPSSPLSIARAVKRHLGMAGDELPLLDAADFIRRIVTEGD